MIWHFEDNRCRMASHPTLLLRMQKLFLFPSLNSFLKSNSDRRGQVNRFHIIKWAFLGLPARRQAFITFYKLVVKPTGVKLSEILRVMKTLKVSFKLLERQRSNDDWNEINHCLDRRGKSFFSQYSIKNIVPKLVDRFASILPSFPFLMHYPSSIHASSMLHP
jgi:hypothetical protein